MSEHPRMLDGTKPPEPSQVAEWIGPRASAHWDELTGFIESRYPGVFDRTWWFGGKKWGWSLRFKKSRSFCNLIPERGQFKALLVFGADEREKVEAVLPQLSSHVRDDYAAATTFHDGKWVAVVVDSRKVVTDIERLLVLKRKPKGERLSGAEGPKGETRGRLGGAAMTPRMTTCGTFAVLGVACRIRRGSESPELFGRIWRTFESCRAQIEPAATHKVYFGVSFPTDEEGTTEYLAGMMVAAGTPPPEGLEARTVSGGQYAVFECPVDAIGATYQHVFGVWLPSAAVQFDPGRAPFEEYPENAPEQPVRLHIPVRQQPTLSPGCATRPRR